MAWPLSLLAEPENTLTQLFNPSFGFNIGSERTDNRHNDVAQRNGEAAFGGNDNNASVDDYMQVAFDYLNKKLGFTPQDVSLKPMVGVDIFHAFNAGDGVTVTPEIYAIYRYEAIDDNLPLFNHHSLQTGLGIAINVADSVSAHFSLDSDLITGSDRRVAFIMKYRW